MLQRDKSARSSSNEERKEPDGFWDNFDEGTENESMGDTEMSKRIDPPAKPSVSRNFAQSGPNSSQAGPFEGELKLNAANIGPVAQNSELFRRSSFSSSFSSSSGENEAVEEQPRKNTLSSSSSSSILRDDSQLPVAFEPLQLVKKQEEPKTPQKLPEKVVFYPPREAELLGARQISFSSEEESIQIPVKEPPLVRFMEPVSKGLSRESSSSSESVQITHQNFPAVKSEVTDSNPFDPQVSAINVLPGQPLLLTRKPSGSSLSSEASIFAVSRQGPSHSSSNEVCLPPEPLAVLARLHSESSLDSDPSIIRKPTAKNAITVPKFKREVLVEPPKAYVPPSSSSSSSLFEEPREQSELVSGGLSQLKEPECQFPEKGEEQENPQLSSSESRIEVERVALPIEAVLVQAPIVIEHNKVYESYSPRNEQKSLSFIEIGLSFEQLVRRYRALEGPHLQAPWKKSLLTKLCSCMSSGTELPRDKEEELEKFLAFGSVPFDSSDAFHVDLLDNSFLALGLGEPKRYNANEPVLHLTQNHSLELPLATSLNVTSVTLTLFLLIFIENSYKHEFVRIYQASKQSHCPYPFLILLIKIVKGYLECLSKLKFHSLFSESGGTLELCFTLYAGLVFRWFELLAEGAAPQNILCTVLKEAPQRAKSLANELLKSGAN